MVSKPEFELYLPGLQMNWCGSTLHGMLHGKGCYLSHNVMLESSTDYHLLKLQHPIIYSPIPVSDVTSFSSSA